MPEKYPIFCDCVIFRMVIADPARHEIFSIWGGSKPTGHPPWFYAQPTTTLSGNIPHRNILSSQV